MIIGSSGCLSQRILLDPVLPQANCLSPTPFLCTHDLTLPLLCECDTVFVPLQGSNPTAIMQQFGHGKLGSMMALARLLFTDTALWVYGGFIRDAVIRGEVHDEMDLDVGIPYTGMNVDQGMFVVSAEAKTLGMHFLKNGASTDPRLRTCIFRTADGSNEFEVQVCQHFHLHSRSCMAMHGFCLLRRNVSKQSQLNAHNLLYVLVRKNWIIANPQEYSCRAW